MSMLVARCPRCGSDNMTFDVEGQVYIGQWHQWLNKNEVFAVCRNCRRPSLFVIAMTLHGRDRDIELSKKFSADPGLVVRYDGGLNRFWDVERLVGLADVFTRPPPEHLPKEIDTAFREGAKCLAIGCPNAAATMFRLCLDIATAPLLPSAGGAGIPQPNKFQRRNLGPRLDWLFDQGHLPLGLKELASAVKDDGNEGAHTGSLTMNDAEDLLDFAEALLERLFTEPKRIELAQQRREQRHKGR